ncbi:MAG: glycosyltransferase family 92 protein [Selenomonadaceae bacterium]|nr:glycosyltransferase family 92 protein [Selenomonadaceae bacterium]MBQ6132350.1 glycosyltransferase family 92 protein [Selenomonadaceae bacterium]
MVDRNLFLHNLAVVAIMKCEGPYLKEWLDYHLIAGVDHFYLYDNESPDNQAEVAKPYIEAGLVDYFSLPGKAMQMVAYNDAVRRFKFHCRYMAFIDSDEFVYPKVDRGGVFQKSSTKFYRTTPTRQA